MYLLDTNAISALRVRRTGLEKVWAWADSTDAGGYYVSVITIVEVERGIRLMERRDAAQGRVLRDWFAQTTVEFEDRILPVDSAVALRCAALHVPNPMPDFDSLIAATALVHDLTVVTRDIRDFARMGVRTLNPWER